MKAACFGVLFLVCFIPGTAVPPEETCDPVAEVDTEALRAFSEIVRKDTDNRKEQKDDAGKKSPQEYSLAPNKNTSCSDLGLVQITSAADCEAASGLAFSGTNAIPNWDGTRDWSDRLPGCLYCPPYGDLNFNVNSAGEGINADQVPVCAMTPTPFPTPDEELTPAPTTVTAAPDDPTPAPLLTPSPTSVSATGDPHLVNILGDAFEINHPGSYDLLKVPQECHDAVEGEACFAATHRARRTGAKERPEGYQGVSDEVNSSELQAHFWRKGLHDCRKPCGPGRDPSEDTKLIVRAQVTSITSPCSQYITQLEFSGKWMGSLKTVHVRAARKNVSSTLAIKDSSEIVEPFALRLGEKGGWLTLKDVPEEGIILGVKPQGLSGPVKLTSHITQSDRRGTAGKFRFDFAGALVDVTQKRQGRQFMNMELKHLRHFGREDIGGLLGDDPHSKELGEYSKECMTSPWKGDRKGKPPPPKASKEEMEDISKASLLKDVGENDFSVSTGMPRVSQQDGPMARASWK